MTAAVAAVVSSAIPHVYAGANITIPAVATFVDAVPYAITSDGAPYVDGSSGMTSHFFTTLGQKDWVQFHSTRSRRTVSFHPTAVDASSPVLPPLTAEQPIINIDDVASTTTAEPRVLSSAGFDTSAGRFRFDDSSGCRVAAVFDGANQWTISTDAIPDPDDPAQLSGDVCDIARLIQVKQIKRQYTETTLGYYHLPFRVSVRYK
jgi:hypothetical protein